MSELANSGQKKLFNAGWLSLLVNIFLIALNFTMAALSGSLALLAETTHNVLDLIASISVLVGLFLSQRKTRKFPYGLYKIENFVALFIALGTFFTGYEIIRQVFFAPSRVPDVRPLMLGGVLLAAAIPFTFSQYELRLGKKVNSPSLIANATEFRAHVLSSGVVFAALLGQMFGLPLDRPAALLIVLWIAYAGWTLLQNAMRVLLDASLDNNTLNLVRELIASHPEVVQVKSLMGRNSGRYHFIETEIVLNIVDLEKAHRIASEIEDQIRNEVPFVERVLVHTEPVMHEILRIAIPLSEENDAIMANELGAAKRFAFYDFRSTDGQIIKQEILPNPYASEDKGRGIHLADWLKAHGANIVLTPTPPKPSGLMYALQAGAVRLEQAVSQDLAPALSQVIEKNRQLVRETQNQMS